MFDKCYGERKILISDATQMGVERNVLTFKARVITFRLQVLYMSSVIKVPDRQRSGLHISIIQWLALAFVSWCFG